MDVRSTGSWEIEWISRCEIFCPMSGAWKQKRYLIESLVEHPKINNHVSRAQPEGFRDPMNNLAQAGVMVDRVLAFARPERTETHRNFGRIVCVFSLISDNRTKRQSGKPKSRSFEWIS
jgi:hypothetical protein